MAVSDDGTAIAGVTVNANFEQLAVRWVGSNPNTVSYWMADPAEDE